MKKFFLFVATVFSLISCSFSASASEPQIEETRVVKAFTQILVKGSPTVIYTQGNKCSVKVKAPQNLIKEIKTVSNGNLLEIGRDDKLRKLGFNNSNDMIVVYVTSPDIVGVDVMGSGEFVSEKPIDTDNISLKVRGSGEISVKGHLICDNAKILVAGSGDINVSDLEALTSNVQVVGSGDINLRQRNVNQTRVELTGSGDIEIDCLNCDKLNSVLTGSGDISISGSVRQLKKSKAGSGSYDINIEQQ